MKVEPRPTSLVASMCPPLWVTKAKTVASPSPVPLPGGLVVKYGSNARDSVAASMPKPVSITRNITDGAARPGSARDATVAGLDVMRPPHRHRVARVEEQVHQRLLELADVHVDPAQPRLEAEHDVDALAEQRLQRAHHAGDDRR